MRETFIALALCSVVFLSGFVLAMAVYFNRQWSSEADKKSPTSSQPPPSNT